MASCKDCVHVEVCEDFTKAKLSPKRAAKNPRFNVMFGKMFYNALFMATEN